MTAVAIRPGPEPTRRVRVWFGEHVIADHKTDDESARNYAHAMGRRFAGLRVTNDPLELSPPATDGESRPLPSERLWETVPPH